MTPAKSKLESWLFRVMNDPALEWARPRTVRRLLALAMVTLAVGFAATMWVLPSLWWFAPLLVIFIPLMGSLNGGIRGLTELREHQLDERENRARDKAFRKVFWPALIIAMVGVVLASLEGLPPETRAGIAMAAFILVMTLPTLYLASTLPDDP